MRLNKLEVKILRWLEQLGPDWAQGPPSKKPMQEMFGCSQRDSLTALIHLCGLKLIEGQSIAHASAFAVTGGGITAEGRQYLRELDGKKADHAKAVVLYALKQVVVPMLVSAATALVVTGLR